MNIRVIFGQFFGLGVQAALEFSRRCHPLPLLLAGDRLLAGYLLACCLCVPPSPPTLLPRSHASVECLRYLHLICSAPEGQALLLMHGCEALA